MGFEDKVAPVSGIESRSAEKHRKTPRPFNLGTFYECQRQKGTFHWDLHAPRACVVETDSRQCTEAVVKK
jgi:hypothetical protein